MQMIWSGDSGGTVSIFFVVTSVLEGVCWKLETVMSSNELGITTDTFIVIVIILSKFLSPYFSC